MITEFWFRYNNLNVKSTEQTRVFPEIQAKPWIRVKTVIFNKINLH